MANHKSSEKRMRQTEKRTERNRATKAKVKTLTKKIDTAIAANDTTGVKDAVKAATKQLQRAASKGVLHKNTVARRQSKLAKKVVSAAS